MTQAVGICYQCDQPDSITSVRQLLLRVDDALHALLTEQARAERRSVNALANDILTAATTGAASARTRVRLRAAALGMLASPLGEPRPTPPTSTERDKILAKTRGMGPILDRILDEDRDRS
jgi:hypothetical protein